MDIKDLIIRYGMVTRRRFTKSEKHRFLLGVIKEFTEMNYKTDVKEATKAQRNAYNLYVGDVEKSDVIITTYYDTPPKTFGIIPHKAFSPKNDALSFKVSILIPVAIILLIAGFFMLYIFPPILNDNVFNYKDVIAYAVIFVFVYLLFRFKNGIGNSSNLIRNTSSVIAILKFSEKIDKKYKNKVSMALTDYGCINHFGDEMLRSQMNDKEDSKPVIFLDSIGSFQNISILYHNSAKSIIEKAKEKLSDENINYIEIDDYDTNHYNLFKNTILITSGKYENNDIYIDNTNTLKDNNVNEENIEKTVRILESLIPASIK